MKRKKTTPDRLSELLESLILDILSLLETKEAVKTCLLSKQWGYLWTSILCLEFKEKAAARVRTLIDGVRRRWSGTRILKFKIDLSSSDTFLASSFTSSDLNSSLRFATEKNVESLDLRLPFHIDFNPFIHPSLYLLPQCLFSCSSITHLSLDGVSLPVGGDLQLQWYNLKSLYLRGLSFSEAAILEVVSSAPKLQEFLLCLQKCRDNLTIKSSSLKVLMIVKYNYDQSRYTNLTIWAPELKVLYIEGNSYSKCLLMDVSALIRARLYFFDGRLEALRNTLMQILPQIQHVELLILSPCSFLMVGVVMLMMKSCSISPFTKVKTLELCGGPIKPKEIVCLGELFPKVETLKIDWILNDQCYPVRLAEVMEKNVDDEAIKNNLCKWMQLKRVEFTWHSYMDVDSSLFVDSSMFKVFDFFMNHATMVQEIVIRKGGSAHVAAEAHFRVLFSQIIVPTKDCSITFFESKIAIRRRRRV